MPQAPSLSIKKIECDKMLPEEEVSKVETELCKQKKKRKRKG